jgi:hypothetical protein
VLPSSNASAIAQFGVENIATVAQVNGSNVQGTIQAGHRNNATTGQSTNSLGLLPKQNAALTIQGGSSNTAVTSQSIANPLNVGLNGSLTAQFGKGNTATVGQADSGTGLQPMIGANLQATVQVGSYNSAITSQVASAAVSNTSVTAQFGSHNTAVTVQK